MRHILVSLLPAAALSFAAAPALAQIYPNGGGDTYPSGGGVTLPYSTFAPAPSAYGYGPAAYGPGYEYAWPMTILQAPFAALGAGVTAVTPHPNCGVVRNFTNQYTAVCGP